MPRSWKPTQNNFKSVSSGAEDAIVARMQALVNDPKWRDGALLKMPFASCGLSK